MIEKINRNVKDENAPLHLVIEKLNEVIGVLNSITNPTLRNPIDALGVPDIIFKGTVKNADELPAEAEAGWFYVSEESHDNITVAYVFKDGKFEQHSYSNSISIQSCL